MSATLCPFCGAYSTRSCELEEDTGGFCPWEEASDAMDDGDDDDLEDWLNDRYTHKGWLIEQNWLGQWEATHPDYDPTPMHLYDPPGDNRSVTAGSREEVIEEIDFWLLENEEQSA